MQSHGDGGIRWSYGRWHHRSGRERSGWTGTSWGTTAAARRRRCDGDNGHLKRLVHLSHEERKQQQQQSTHSHTPDLAFTLAFTVLVFTTFIISIALVDCCVVRSRHANYWAVRRGKSSPSPPSPCAAATAAVLLLQPPRSLLLPVQRIRSSCRRAGSADSGCRAGRFTIVPPPLPPPPPPNPPTPPSLIPPPSSVSDDPLGPSSVCSSITMTDLAK